jgi:peptide/nickel transport system permease protein
MGYDIFSELVFAASSTLSAGIAAACISLAAGTIIGLLAGYAPRRRAEIFNIIITVFLQIPMLPAAIVIAAFLGPGRGNIIFTIALLGWCPTARAVRARTMQLKQSGFVEALKILDIPRFRILFHHLLPNLREVVFARYIMSVSSCIMMEASLSFIGLGDTVRVTWGGMINFAFKRGGFVKGAFNWFLAPGVCITLCVLAFYCINVFFEERASTVDGPGQSYLD